MAKRNYFDRLMTRRSLAELYPSSSSFNDGHNFSLASRRSRHSLLSDTKICSNKTSSSPPSSSITMPSNPEPLSSLDLIGCSLKCDDCQTHDGLFQCCHCNQRLCIRCCNKHYKKMTVELERLHELSERLMTKIVHTKNDLERQKNETLEQCHKWRVDTINSINKAHSLIVQTIHNEYDALGKEYELFVQKEMAHLNLDQNELSRLKKGNLGALLTSASSNVNDSTNAIDTIRKRIETFAKHIDETGKCSFEVQLPKFDIDDSLRVESRFGDVTRCTSATWQPEEQTPLFVSNDPSSPVEEFPVNETNHHDDPIDETGSDSESQTSVSSPTVEPVHSDSTSTPSSRYALSVEHDIELQQQQFYRPSFRSDRYDSAYGTAPSSPSSSRSNPYDRYASSSSLHDHASKKFSYGSHQDFGSFYNNRRHTHTFDRTNSTSPTFASSTDPDEDTYQSVQHVQLKQEQDGSLEGVAIQIEQSQTNDGRIKQSRTCVEACGIRRRTTTIIPSQTSSSSSNSTRLSNDQSWLSHRTTSSPSFIQ